MQLINMTVKHINLNECGIVTTLVGLQANYAQDIGNNGLMVRNAYR